jgi:hypothetical protein
VVEPRDELPGEDVDALLTVVVGDEAREGVGEEPRTDPVLGEGHRHLHAARREGGGDLRADEAAADDDDPETRRRELVQAAKVVDRSEVHDPCVVSREPAGRGARRQEHTLVRVLDAVGVHDRVPPGVERLDAAPRVDLDAELGRPAPDRALVSPGPEPFRERRPRVRRMRLACEQPDAPVGVAIADAAARGVGGHAAAYDDVPVVGHETWILDTSIRATR